MRKQVQIYGDSVMRGVILGEDNRYCFSRGGKIDAFMQEFPVDIQNKSSFGCTVTKGCQLLEKGLKKQETSPSCGKRWAAANPVTMRCWNSAETTVISTGRKSQPRPRRSTCPKRRCQSLRG